MTTPTLNTDGEPGKYEVELNGYEAQNLLAMFNDWVVTPDSAFTITLRQQGKRVFAWPTDHPDNIKKL